MSELMSKDEGEDAAFLIVNDAFKAQESSSPTGGIDFEGVYQDLQIKTDGKGLPLSIEMQDLEHIQIDGLVPVIINITPMPNLPMLLGFDLREKDDNLESADMIADKPKELSLLN